MHLIKISSGELVDRLVIMELKYKAAPDDIRGNITCHLNELKENYINLDSAHKDLDVKKRQLERVNQKLWLLEDEIRCDDIKDKSCIAQQIAIVNDIRSVIKRDIDILAGEQTSECKSYTVKYSQRLLAETWIEIELAYLQSDPARIVGGNPSALEIFMQFLKDQFGLHLSANESENILMLSVQQLAVAIDEKAVSHSWQTAK